MHFKKNLFIDGEIVNLHHHFFLRVQYEDIDIGGIVYHSKHLSFMERGRSSFIRLMGYPNEDLIKENIVLVVNKGEIRWLTPLKLGTVIIIESKINKLKRASLEIFQKIKDYNTKTIYSEGSFRIASINKEGNLTKLSKNFIKSLEKYLCLTLD